MNSNDSRLAEIERDISYTEESKRKAQGEVNHFTTELERINRELTYFRSELNKFDAKLTDLHQQEKRRRDEINQEARSKQ